ATPRSISPARDGVSTHSRDGDPIAAAIRANLKTAFQARVLSGHAAIAANAPAAPKYIPAKYRAYRFRISDKFPVPDLPRDNPLLVERVELGQQLFHEPLMSRNGDLSCASCHDPRHAFADPRRYSRGVDGQAGARNAMPLFNLAWKSAFFW